MVDEVVAGLFGFAPATTQVVSVPGLPQGISCPDPAGVDGLGKEEGYGRGVVLDSVQIPVVRCPNRRDDAWRG